MTTGQPQPFYHWVNSNNDVISNQSALTFRNISMETDMDCRCIASNGVSSTEAVEKLQLQCTSNPLIEKNESRNRLLVLHKKVISSRDDLRYSFSDTEL